MPATAVESFLAALKHPRKDAILSVRSLILGAAPGIREEIKWNAPTFSTTGPFATFHLRAKDGIQVVLHLGAKRRDDTVRGAIADPASLLEWRDKDRAIVTFRDLPDVEAKREAFAAIVRQWVTFV